MTVVPAEEGYLARVSAGIIISKLQSIKSKLVIPANIDQHGRLKPHVQHAVRIIESRIRLIERGWQARYGQGALAQRAMIELCLDHQDDGSLFEINGKRHSIGRMDCRACDSSFSTGFPVPLVRLCPVCKKGLQHAWTLEIKPVVDSDMLEGTLPTLRDVRCNTEDARDQKDRLAGTFKGYYQCERCGNLEEREL